MAKAGFTAGMDAARVGACFMVIVLHAAAVNFHVFDDQWGASNFYDSLTRSCVPVFLMISGVLLLNRQESLPAFFSKRFARILPPLLFWSLFYMAWNAFHGKHYGNVFGWLKALANGPVAFHLWYLYAILGIYLFVPFLRTIWQAAGAAEKKLFLAIWMLASAWPIAQSAFGLALDLPGTYALGSFAGLIGYLFLGASVCIFNVLYDLGHRLQSHSTLLNKISACTLGVYCVHIFILQRTEEWTGLLGSDASSWWAIPLMATFVFAVSLGTVLLLRQFRPFVHVT